MLPCMWDDAYKITHAANRKNVAHVALAGFPTNRITHTTACTIGNAAKITGYEQGWINH